MSNGPNSDQSERERSLANAYLDSLLIMGRCAAEVCPPIGTGVHETLLRLRRRLAYDPKMAGLDEAHGVVESTMRDFGRRSKEHSDKRHGESSSLLALVTQTADLLSARDRSYLELLRELSKRLQTAATKVDPEQSRKLAEQVAISLTRLTETFQDDSAIALVQLRHELAGFQQRRYESEETSTLDAITGMFNRREIEHRIRQAMLTGRQFCVLKLGVHEFSGVWDAHGQMGRNLVVKAVSEKLADQVRPRDVVGVWNDRTFLLLFFTCPLANAETRAQQISNWISGEYRITVKRGDVVADVQVTAAATEALATESVDDFVERAEALSPVVMSRS